MEFSISKISSDKIKELVKVSSSISDVSIQRNLFIMKADTNKLYAIVYGNGNIVRFNVEIENFANEGPSNYFYIDIGQFTQALDKVFMASGAEEVKVKLDKTRLVVSNGKSKITVNMFDNLEEAEYEEAFNAYEAKQSNFTTPSKVIISKEMMDFASVVGKYITMIDKPDLVTGFAVEGTGLYYSDMCLSIVHKELSYSASTERLFIPQTMFSFLSSLSLIGNFNLNYSDDKTLVSVSIPEANFDAIMSMPLVTAEYPTDEEMAAMLPTEDNQFSFDIDIPTFLTKMSTFDGVFPSAQWRWKSVDFNFNKADSSISMAHTSASAEVDTDLPVSNVNVVSSEEDLNFKLATIVVYDFLSKLAKDQTTVHVCASPIGPSTECDDGGRHGLGVKFVVDGMSFIISKMETSDEVM